MKGLRQISLIIVRLLLFICLFTIIFSYSFEGFVETGVSKFLVNSYKTSQVIEKVGIDKSKVEEVVESKEVQKFISTYADDFINDIINGEVDENVDLGTKVLDFVNENRVELERIVGEPLPMEEIEKVVNSKDFKEINTGYNQIIHKSNDIISQDVRNMIKIFDYFMSDTFKVLLIVVSVILIVLIALLQWSLVEWIRTLGRILVICGIVVFIITSIISLVYSGISNMFPLTFSFNFMTMFMGAVISLILGVMLTSGYKLGNKVITKTKSVNE